MSILTYLQNKHVIVKCHGYFTSHFLMSTLYALHLMSNPIDNRWIPLVLIKDTVCFSFVLVAEVLRCSTDWMYHPVT